MVLLAVAASVAIYDGCGGGSSPTPPPSTVIVSPATATVPVGATQQFTANTQVTWSIQNATPALGSISSAGLYTAPNTVPSGAVTIVATSQADTTKSGAATVTVTLPGPSLSSLSPIVAMANTAVTLTANGTGFAGISQIVFEGSAKPTTFSGGQLNAQLSASDLAQPGSYQVTVQTNGMSTSPRTFYVVPTISPTPVSVVAGSPSNVDPIPVQQPKLFASGPLSWVAIGTGTSAGVAPVSVKQGASVTLFAVGQGFQAGIFFSVSGATGDFIVTQPLVANFSQTTDTPPIPAANVAVTVSGSATPGARNVLVTNPAGEISVFPGGLVVTQGP